MSTGDSEDSEVELTLAFAGLRVSVQGPLERAAEFVQQVSRLPLAATNQASGSLAVASPGLRGNGSPTASVAGTLGSESSDTRASILASFPHCPDHLLRLAGRLLSGGPRFSAELRATRAWIAGCWAKAVLAGRVQSPNRTATIDLPNRCWVVLRSSRISTPAVFFASGAYRRAVGPLEAGDSVSHAFPSETEAKIYVEAAGFDTSDENWQRWRS